MNYFLVAELNGESRIFGEGNTMATAWSAGRSNVSDEGALNAKAIAETRVPKNTKWFDEQ